MSDLKRKPTHDYALRCRAPRDNKNEFGLKRDGMKPIVLFEQKEGEVVAKTVKTKVKNNAKTKTVAAKVPEPETRIVPIAFDLEESPKPSTPTVITIEDTPPPVTATSIKNPFSRLDLPTVFHTLKSDCLKGVMKNKTGEDKLKCKRRPKIQNGVSSSQSTIPLDEMMSNLAIGDSSSLPSKSQFRKVNFQPLDTYLDNVINQNIQMISNSTNVDSPPFISSSPGSEFSVSKDTLRKLIAGGLQIDPWKEHAEFFKIAHKGDCLDSDNALTIVKSPVVQTKVNRQIVVNQITMSLNLDATKLKEFQIYPKTAILESLKHYLCSNLFPDALKHAAFSYWQKMEMDKCVYFLSESHGTYLRTEILDKHNAYFTRADEFVSSSSSFRDDPKSEKLKLKKYHQQSNDLIAVGKSQASFYSHLDKLDPDWNIIQLTTMFHVHNRFSNAPVTDSQTPALFLTCFSTASGSTNRNAFVTYIREPVTTDGLSQSGILGDFKKVMLKNRSINEKYTGDRRKYWEVREEHNSDLRNVMNAVQENWLSPWYFLLPGNVTDLETRKKIQGFLVAVELALYKRLTPYQKVVLYKLVENFNFLAESVRDTVLLDLVAYILEVAKEKVQKITQKILQIGSSIKMNAERHPTILILDQGIEQLPWDWMQCLKTTNVTRVQSISVMYSLMNMVKAMPPVDPSLATYVLNPDGSLKSVQTRLEGYFSSRKTWVGYAGKKPSYKDIDTALQDKSLFLFCGHGSGQCLFPDYLLQKIYCRAIPVLMGCGSAQYKYCGPKGYATSVVNSYFVAACPSVVGFLWEVTDVECDRVTVELLEHWSPGNGPIPPMASFDNTSTRPKIACLATAVRLSRKGATQYLTQAGIVNYGLPIKRIL